MRGTPLDYIIVIAYFAGILGFGSFFARYTKSTKDFFFGGQRFAWWLIAASLVATGIGSYSFIKYAQAGFVRGMSSSMTYLNDWLMIPLFMFGWLPIIYFARIRSVPEYFERRFDKRSRLVATILTLGYLIGYIGLNYYLLGIAMRSLLGVPLHVTIPIVAVISAIYITAGGQTAVIFTDLVQGVFLYAAGAILLILGIHHIGGFSAFWEGLDIAHRLPYPKFNEPMDFNFSAIFWGEGVVGTLAFTFINQGFIMRYLAVKSVFEGRKTLTFNTLILMPISAVVVGSAGWIAFSALTHGKFTAPESSKDVFIHIVDVITKPGIFGFVIAALTAALMSTIDTLINACTAIGIFDVYRPYVKPGASDRHYLKASRFVSVTVTLLGLALVPAFNTSQSIFAAHYAFVGMITPPMLVAIFLGVTWKRFTPQAAFWSMLGGAFLIGLSVIWPEIIAPLASTHGIRHVITQIGPGGEPIQIENSFKYFRSVYGLLVTGVLGVLITFFTRPKPKEAIQGLTLSTIQAGKALFKGGKPNEKPGRKVSLALEIDETDGETVALHPDDLERLQAEPGDLLYIADARFYLGGLRSLHVKAGPPSDRRGVARLPRRLVEEGNLKPEKGVRVEKVM